jgi:hypothetical protein
MTWNSSQYNQVWNAVFNPISGLPTPDEQLQSNFHSPEPNMANSPSENERLYELSAKQEMANSPLENERKEETNG